MKKRQTPAIFSKIRKNTCTFSFYVYNILYIVFIIQYTMCIQIQRSDRFHDQALKLKSIRKDQSRPGCTGQTG